MKFAELRHQSLVSLFLKNKANFYRTTCSVGLQEKVDSSLLLWPSHKVTLGTVRQDGLHKAITSNTNEKE